MMKGFERMIRQEDDWLYEQGIDDERVLNVTITQQGEALKEQAVQIPRKMQGCVAMDPEDAKTLYRILHKILEAAV